MIGPKALHTRRLAALYAAAHERLDCAGRLRWYNSGGGVTTGTPYEYVQALHGMHYEDVRAASISAGLEIQA